MSCTFPAAGRRGKMWLNEISGADKRQSELSEEGLTPTISAGSLPIFRRGDKLAGAVLSIQTRRAGVCLLRVPRGVCEHVKKRSTNMLKKLLAGYCLLLLSSAYAADSACPAWLNQDKRLLHSEHSKNLCAYGGKPLLIVNTASHCGFTPQFKGLEALYQRYRAQGLNVIGFSSDDFRQEAGDEEQTAKVCFANFGVTFDMYAPIAVSGANADPLYKELARAGGGFPKWNFYKYLIDRHGVVVKRFSSLDTPDGDAMRTAIEGVLAAP